MKRHSFQPRNFKALIASVSGARVQNQRVEQKMLLVFLSLRKIREFSELCSGELGRLQYTYFCYVSQPTSQRSFQRKAFFNTKIFKNIHSSKTPGDSPGKKMDRTSLVIQWIRTCLLMQETQVWSLVQEELTCQGKTKPLRHNYWACALEPVLHNKRSQHNEKPLHHKENVPA